MAAYLLSFFIAVCLGVAQVLGNCGVPQISQGRVISGSTAPHGAWPWQVLMKRYGKPECGGSIISPDWVVTAAHCVDGKEFPPNAFSVVAGEHTWHTRENTEAEHYVSKVIKHNGFSQYTFDNDIALLKLAKPFIFNKYVAPVCLPTKPVPVGTPCVISGWGKIMHPGQMHPVLQQATMSVVGNDVCHRKNRMVLPFAITKNMVCSGDAGHTRTSGCHGDSGGPFVCRTGPNGSWELHGAVSHGSGSCSSRETYTVYARVHELRSWIDYVVRNN